MNRIPKDLQMDQDMDKGPAVADQDRCKEDAGVRQRVEWAFPERRYNDRRSGLEPVGRANGSA